MLHQIPVARFRDPQRFMRLGIFVAQTLLRHGSRQSNRQPRQMIFENVFVGALLDAFDRSFLAQSSGHQEKRYVFSGAAQFQERVEATPGG